MAVMVCALWSVCLTVAAQQSDTSFGGFFEAIIETTQTASVLVEEIGINSVLSVGGWVASIDARFTDTELDTLSVFTSGSLGNVSLNSSLEFNPSTVAFVSWQSGVSFTLLDLAFSDILYVAASQTNSYSQLTATGSFGDRTFRLSAKFGICPILFWEASACVDWFWDACETNLSACVEITDVGGLEAIDLTMTDCTLFESFFGMRGSLAVALSFTLNEKTLSPTLTIEPDWIYCTDVELLGEISAGSELVSVEALLVYGIVGECSIGESVSIRFADSFVSEKNGAVTGNADYFELIEVSGAIPSCCGADGSFDVAAYFDRSSTALFDLGLVTASLETQIAAPFAFAFAAEFPTDGAGWRLSWTFRIIW